MRNFDDCFEMGDGDEVRRLLIGRAIDNESLYDAMIYHGCAEWVADVQKLRAAQEAVFQQLAIK